MTNLSEVLVVDDEEGVRELIVSYFNDLGVMAAGAVDGRAAITALQRSEGRFGLVITDLNMPGADGFAVLRAAHEANPNTYVVIITGYATLDSAIHAVRVGAYDYLTKPFSLGQLDVIRRRISDRISLECAAAEHRSGLEAKVAAPPAADLAALERRIDAMDAMIRQMASTLDVFIGAMPGRQ